jgi:hypothetical protein
MLVTTELEDHIQKAVDHKVPPLDIMHGELKNLMYETEQKLSEYIDHDNEQWDQTVDRLHLEGRLDAYVDLYELTYLLSFAISDRDEELTIPLDFGNI